MDEVSFLVLPVYQELGFGKTELDEIKQFRRQRAAGGDETAFRKFFRRDLHDGLVRNLRKVGLITERIAPSLESFGALLNGRNRVVRDVFTALFISTSFGICSRVCLTRGPKLFVHRTILAAGL